MKFGKKKGTKVRAARPRRFSIQNRVEPLETRRLLSGVSAVASTFVADPELAPDTVPPSYALIPTYVGGLYQPRNVVPEGGMGTFQFQIIFTDDRYLGIDTAFIRPDGVTVRPPGGDAATAMPAVLIDAPPPGLANTLVATYRVAAPGGAFDATDNGTYTVHVADGTVRDLAGNAFVERDIGTFDVQILAPEPGTPAPDIELAIAAPAPTDAVDAGSWSRMTVVVTNRGDAPTGGFPIGIVASTDRVRDELDPGLGARHKRIRNLLPGESRTVVLRFRQSPPGAWDPGPVENPFYLIAHADYINAIVERDEANNFAVQPEPVAAHPWLIDLALGEVGFPASDALALDGSKRVALAATVSNLGSTRFHGRVGIGVFASIDGTTAVPDGLLGSIDVPVKLGMNAARRVRVRLRHNSELTAGNYFLIARLSGHGQIVETSEANNTLVSPIAYVVS